LRSSSLREELAELAYSRAVSMFTEDKFVGAYRAAYAELTALQDSLARQSASAA
jgi:hypothetical protein